MPTVEKVIMSGLDRELFGVQDINNTLDVLIKELDTMDGILYDMRQQNEYKQAFDEDNRHTNRMRQLYSLYEDFLDYPDSQTNVDQLNSSCHTNDPSVVMDFYDKQLNDLGDGTIGKLISKSWKMSTTKSMAKLYFLKMDIASQLIGVCKALWSTNDLISLAAITNYDKVSIKAEVSKRDIAEIPSEKKN